MRRSYQEPRRGHRMIAQQTFRGASAGTVGLVRPMDGESDQARGSTSRAVIQPDPRRPETRFILVCGVEAGPVSSNGYACRSSLNVGSDGAALLREPRDTQIKSAITKGYEAGTKDRIGDGSRLEPSIAGVAPGHTNSLSGLTECKVCRELSDGNCGELRCPFAKQMNSTTNQSNPANPQITAWAAQCEEEWRQMFDGGWPESLTLRDILSRPKPPEWFVREREEQYRKGFLHGIIEASRIVSRLYRKGGYVRPQEISNILGEWSEELYQWKRSTLRETPLNNFVHPELRWRKWTDVKQDVHERDGHKCVECGSSSQLEAHHVFPVCDGGTPSMDNLVTLCRECHRGAKLSNPAVAGALRV